MADELARLEAWMGEEGIETGARQLKGVDYDCNWGPISFLVTLCSYKDTGKARLCTKHEGHGPNQIGGLAIALKDALDKAGAK